MYSIYINKKDYETKTLELTVFVLQYDIEHKTHAPLPEHKSFFLDFLLHCESEGNMYIRIITNSLNNNYTNGFLAINSDTFIQHIKQTSTKNLPFEKWLKKYHQKSKISEKEFPKLVQATYTIELVEEAYMYHICEEIYYKGYNYDGNFRDIAPIEKQHLDLSLLPNTSHSLQNILLRLSKYHNKPINIKISNNSAYIFLTCINNTLSIIETKTWSLKWETTIEDAYNIIYEDSNQDILWLQDYDEIVEAFDIHTGKKVEYNRCVDYYLSPSLNLSTHWDENAPIEIKDKAGNIISTIPLKNNNFYALAFSNNDIFLAIGYDKNIDIWNIEKQVLVQSISFKKGVLHKLIFGHDSSLIYALANGIVYGINLKNSHIVFKDSIRNKNHHISNFDINDKFYAMVQTSIPALDSFYYTCDIYNLGGEEFIINNYTLEALTREEKNRRKQQNRWRKVLEKIPYNDLTSPYINTLKISLYRTDIWTDLGINAPEEYKIEIFSIPVEIAPNNPLYLYNLGTIYKHIEDYDNAIFYLRKALVINPNYANAQLNLAISLSENGAIEEAKNIYLSLLDKKQHEAKCYNLLSMIYLESGELDKAKDMGINAILSENSAINYMNLGHYYYLINDIENANKQYQYSFNQLNDYQKFIDYMIDDYYIIKLYNISQETWMNFIESFRPIPV